MSAEVTPAVRRAADELERRCREVEFYDVIAHAALAKALDVEELAKAMYAAHPLVVDDEEIPWERILTDPDRAHIADEHRRDAQAACMSILGRDAVPPLEVWELDVEDGDDDY